MKQPSELIELASKLVEDGKPFILFHNNEVLKESLPDGIKLTTKAIIPDFSLEVLKNSKEEEQARMQVKTPNLIQISKDAELTVIHTGDVVAAIGLGFIVDEEVQAQINHVFYRVEEKANVMIDLVCKKKSNVVIKNIYNFYDDIQTFIHAYCYSDAYIKIDDFAINQKGAKCNTDVVLLEEQATVLFNNVAINASKQKQSYKYNVFHVNKNTTSTITNYGISKNDSFLVFDNTGTITKGSSNSIMNQRTKGIILDLHSSISANPILAIDEADVVANHGASIGAIDEEDLFYLMSRGLSYQESVALVVNGLIAPYFRDMKNEKITEYLTSETAKYL